MSWDQKNGIGQRYYYRNIRRDGRPAKIYFGRGKRAEQAAHDDEKARRQRRLDRQHWDCVLTRLDRQAATTSSLAQWTTLLMRAVLVYSGWYLHQRHEWRRRKNHG